MRCTQYGSCARDAPGPFKFKKNSETRGIATNKSIDSKAIYTTRKLMRNELGHTFEHDECRKQHRGVLLWAAE